MAVIVDTLVLSRTVRIRWGSQAATGVFIEYRELGLLVTAAHLVRDAKAGDRIGVRHNGDWIFVEIIAIFFADNGIDVAAIVPAARWGEGLPWEMINNEILVGEDVAFCGFPLGLEMTGMPDFLGWPTALVKSGVFSGGIKENGETVFYFDATNNVGFSGGPILRRSSQDQKLSVVGIVSNYKYDVPQSVRTKNEKGEDENTDYFVLPNSGFMRGVPAFQIKKLITDHLGPNNTPIKQEAL